MGTKKIDRNIKGKFIAKDNIYVIKDDIVECYNQNNFLLFFTDISNLEKIKKYNWSKYANGYVCGCKNNKKVALHRYLMNCEEKNKVVDHINRNKKDNRLCNLRVCGKSLNAFNVDIRKNNTSGVTGVWFRKDTKKWVAEIKKDYKKICLGCYKTKEEAVLARKKAEKEIGG